MILTEVPAHQTGKRFSIATVESSTLLRLLAGLGATLTILGAWASIISGFFLGEGLHDQYAAEHIFILSLGLATGFFIWQDRLRALGYIAVVILATIGLCVATEVRHRLASTLPRGGENGLDVFWRSGGEALLSLWRSHVGWAFVAVSVGIFIYVGSRAGSYSFYTQMERRRAYKQGQIVSRRDEVLSEIAKAPLWPLAYGGVFILSGIIILFAGGEVSLTRKLIGALVSEFGFAFFIAYILTISLEIHQKREHDRQISRGLLSVVYGVNLDQKLFLATEQYVFKNHFYRRNVVVEFDFLKVVGEWMLMKYTLTYVVENVGSGRASYLIDGHVEKVPEHPELLDEGMCFGLNKIYVGGAELTEEQIKAARAAVPDDDKYRRSRHIVPFEAGEKKMVRTIALTAKRTIDNELWRSLLPCSSASLRITWPESIKLKMLAEPVHPSDDFKFEDADPKTRAFFGTIDQPLFPHNGFIFWWRPDDVSECGVAEGVVAGEPSHPVSAPPEVAADRQEQHASRPGIVGRTITALHRLKDKIPWFTTRSGESDGGVRHGSLG